LTSVREAPCPFGINRARRAIKIHDGLAAWLVTGKDKIASGFGNGDCILIDMQNLFFAVADASDRFPTASRGLLRRLASELERGPTPGDEREWLEKVNKAYAVQPYVQKTTFSGVALENRSGRESVCIIHGGDSMIFLVNMDRGVVEYTTGSDMNFAGRINKLSGAQRVFLEGGRYRIILASDGLADLARLAKMSIEELCVEVFGRCPLDDLLDRFSRTLGGGEKHGGHDDISIIALDPDKLESGRGWSVLLGGTTPVEESRFQNGLKNLQFQDTWICPGPAMSGVPGVEIRFTKPVRL
jgi:hypothetical protein